MAFCFGPAIARAESPAHALEPAADTVALGTEKSGGPIARQPQSDDPLAGLDQAEEEFEEYDPWEPFNEKTFKFNYNLDKYAIKPVAKAYDKVVPNFVERAIVNIFENIGSFRRIINLTLQGRFNDSGQELGRFVINTMFGLGGFIDAAPSFGVGKVDADTGQTFGVWGAGPGPYLMLPLTQPLTVRDAVGYVLDSAMDPTSWLVPFEIGFTGSAVKRINDRALNLELYENVEATVFDLYGAVRNGYLQQRRALIRQGLAASPFGHGKHKRSGSDGAKESAVSPPLAPPRVSQEIILGVGATPPSEEETFLIVDAMPSDAQVFLDGLMLGSAGELLARALPVPRGPHTVAIAAPGFKLHIARIDADPSFPARVRIALEPE